MRKRIVCHTHHRSGHVEPAAGRCGGGLESGLAVVILTNLAGAQPEQLIDAVAGFYLPGLKRINSGAYALYRLRLAAEAAGYDGLEQKLQQVMKQDALSTPSQNHLNSWGYRLLSRRQNAAALAVFQLAVARYPDNADAHDNLAEAYQADGATEAAIRHYRRSLELDAGNRNAAERLKGLEGLEGAS